MSRDSVSTPQPLGMAMAIRCQDSPRVSPTKGERGFWYVVKPDVSDQDIPEPLRAMGQYRAEGIEPVKDSPDTIYLGEDQPRGGGGDIYKYILDSPPDLTNGTLYVFKKNEGWIKTEDLEAPDTSKGGTNFVAAEDMHVGPDGKLYMVISALAENKVVAIDLDTAKVTDFVIAKGNKGFERPDQLAFSPNGVLFITAEGEVWAALPDGPDDDTLSDGVFRFLKDLDTVQGSGSPGMAALSTYLPGGVPTGYLPSLDSTSSNLNVSREQAALQFLGHQLGVELRLLTGGHDLT